MAQQKKILVVDDSLIFRHAVEDVLKSDSSITVIGSVRNGAKAMDFIREKRPDLVTLDVEMPEMDGMATLKAIQELNQAGPSLPPVKVIMLSAFTRFGADVTIRALELGAFDFVAKPRTESAEDSLQRLREQLLPKIHACLAGLPAASPDKAAPVVKSPVKQGPLSEVRAVFIGVSTGGPKALTEMLPSLCQKISLPIFIVQHMPATFTASLAESLGKKCAHLVKEGAEGEAVMPRTVYIAPGGRHMTVVSRDGIPRIRLNDQPPENGCRPSVDVLFRSAPDVYPGGCVALILTGMGMDGAKSLRALKREGAIILAQDEKSSVVWGMPGAAVETGLVDAVVSLESIPETVARAVERSGTPGETHGTL